MQPNQITIDVDTANTGSTTAQAYDRFDEYQNRSVYVGANHTPDARDTISLYRTFPTKSGNFKGVMKSSIKLVRDQSVAANDGVSTLTSPAIFELSASLPVGMTAANAVEMRQLLHALIDDDSFMDDLQIKQMV